MFIATKDLNNTVFENILCWTGADGNDNWNVVSITERKAQTAQEDAEMIADALNNTKVLVDALRKIEILSAQFIQSIPSYTRIYKMACKALNDAGVK